MKKNETTTVELADEDVALVLRDTGSDIVIEGYMPEAIEDPDRIASKVEIMLTTLMIIAQRMVKDPFSALQITLEEFGDVEKEEDSST